MGTEEFKPAPILKKEEISPEMIIDNVKSNINELFIKTDENGNPNFNSLDSGIIQLFGAQNALLLEKSSNNIRIANYLEPEYKNALIDAALASGCFQSFLDGWIYSDGTDEINLYREIKTHSLGYTDDKTEDVRNDTKGYGFIYTYEFLHYLGFTDKEDTETHDRLQDDIYNNIIGLLKRNRFSSINPFLRSSVDINFNEKQIGNIKEKYIQELINNIDRRGFEEEYKNGIWTLERKLGKIEDTEKEKVYNSAVSYLLKELKSDCYGSFTEHFENILDYFGKPPKEPKKHLKTFISSILLDDNFSTNAAAYLRSAQELYQRIDGYNKNTDGSFFIGEISKSKKKDKKEATDVKTEIEKHIIEEMKNMTDSFGELISLYDLIFNKEDLRDRVATEAIDSVSRKKELDSEETVESYKFNWENIETKMTKLRDFYPDINLADTSTDEGNAFRKFVKKRILNEAEKGIVSGLDFWETVLSYDKDIRSPFKDLYAKWYRSEDAKQLMNSYWLGNSPLTIVRDYKTVFGDYPEEFYKGFKDKSINCLDSLIAETKEKDGVFDKERARNLRWYMLDDLTKDELYLLPELHEKIIYVNNNYPKISETAISEKFRSC